MALEYKIKQKQTRTRRRMVLDYEDWLKRGIQSIDSNISPQIPFELKKLFVGFGWERLSKGDRISFGRYFSSAVKNGKVPNVQKVQRAKNNHTRYIKIGGDNNTK